MAHGRFTDPISRVEQSEVAVYVIYAPDAGGVEGHVHDSVATFMRTCLTMFPGRSTMLATLLGT